jgi:hypothetical protein
LGLAQLSGDLFNGLARVEEVDDGLALLYVARQPDVVELSGFFCLETDNVYIADFPLKNNFFSLWPIRTIFILCSTLFSAYGIFKEYAIREDLRDFFISLARAQVYIDN